VTWSGIAGACFECNAPTGSEERPYCRRHAWMEVKGPWPEVDEAVAAAIRESGGSSPAGVCPECQQSPCIGHPRASERPLLNKTGGSDEPHIVLHRHAFPRGTNRGGSDVEGK